MLFSPGILIERAEGQSFVCTIKKSMGPGDQIIIGFGHLPLLLVQHEEAEAKQNALNKARTFMPEENGWTNHDVVLLEIPRSTFIQMQLFVTVREVYDRILWLIGLRPSL